MTSQRGWKRQPVGGEIRSGGEPGIPLSTWRGPLTHTTTKLMRIAVDPARLDADNAQQFHGAITGFTLVDLKVGLDRIDNLCANRNHGIEGIHGALEDDGQMPPAEIAQRFGIHL